jgi:hypothetical protein
VPVQGTITWKVSGTNRVARAASGLVVVPVLLLSSCGTNRETSVSTAAHASGTSSSPGTTTTVRSELPTASTKRIGWIAHASRALSCRTRDLSFSIGRAAGVAGSEAVQFHIKHRTRGTCTLSGYFTIRLLDAHGNRVGTRLLDDPNLAGPAGTVLTTGTKAASFTYEWGALQASLAPCPRAAVMELTAPGQHDRVTLAARTANWRAIAPCGNGTTFVSAVTRR